MDNVLPFGRARRARFPFLRRYFGFLAIAAMMIAATALLLVPKHDARASRPVQRDTLRTLHRVRAIDGDTLHADGKRIRLTGIDAPELHQTCRDAQDRKWSCGRAAKARLTELVSHGQVACTARGHDRYGRTLATCSAGDVADLGEALVREGYAVDYRRYSDDYLAAEREARAAGRGIWRGRFERPETWRHRRSG